MMDPDLLPITLYQLEDGVLVGVEKWKLETSPAEKVAVERVVREQPSSDPQQSAFGTHVSTLQGALEKLKDRLGILVQFLQDIQSKKIPFDPELVRQVQGLVCQLGPLVACSTLPHAEDLDELWTLHMAVTAKTVQSVHGYTEKCKQMQESRSHHHPRRF